MQFILAFLSSEYPINIFAQDCDSIFVRGKNDIQKHPLSGIPLQKGYNRPEVCCDSVDFCMILFYTLFTIGLLGNCLEEAGLIGSSNNLSF